MLHRLTHVARIVVLLTIIAIGLLVGPAAAPVQAQEEPPASCRVGAYVMSLHDLDIATDTFAADLWVWSNCPSGEIIPVNSMDFVNANEIEGDLGEPSVVEGVYWTVRKVIGTFRHDWDLRNYPFDRHQLEVVIEDAEYDTSSFVYEPDAQNSSYNPELGLTGWEVIDFELIAGESPYNTTFGDPTLNGTGESVYSKLRVAVTIARHDVMSFFKLISPVYIAFAIALISLLLHAEEADVFSAQMGMLAGSLFTTVVNLSIVGSVLGSEDRLTLVDQLHGVALVGNFVITFLAIQAQLQMRGGREPALIYRANRRWLAGLSSAFVLLNAVLIGLAIVAG